MSDLGAAASPTHSALCRLAERWLRSMGCEPVLRDGLKALTDTGEAPDAIGWRGGISALVECKISRSDFLADRKKPFRIKPELGMGDWRFYLCPPGVIVLGDLPDGWGLLHAIDRRVVPVSDLPPNTRWRSAAPFRGAKLCETQMLCSALRRLDRNGSLGRLYEEAEQGRGEDRPAG